MIVSITGVLVVMGDWVIAAQDKQDKYSLEVPGGLAFSEFKGYEDWPAVGPSYTDAQNVIRLIPANPTMIDAYKRGAPANDKPFPDGSKIAKIEWRPKKVSDAPFSASTLDMVHGDLIKVEFIEKDSKRFSDTHGWGYAMFDYDAASSTFTPATVASKPPQRNAAAIAHHEDPAISHFMGTPMTPAQRAQIMPHEVHDTVNSYLAGKVDQWYFRTDGNGVVFIVCASTPEEAKNILEKFPLGQAALMGFDYIPLGPLSPVRIINDIG